MKKIPKNRLNLQNLQKSTSMHQLGRITETIWSISNIRNNKASRNERPSAARSFRSERRNNLVYSICRFSNDRKTSRRVAFHANITQNRARIRGNRLDWFARGENAPRSVDGYRGEKNWWTAVFTGIFNLSYIFRADCNSRCNVENWKENDFTCRWAWIPPLFNGTMTFIEWNILLEILDRADLNYWNCIKNFVFVNSIVRDNEKGEIKIIYFNY